MSGLRSLLLLLRLLLVLLQSPAVQAGRRRGAGEIFSFFSVLPVCTSSRLNLDGGGGAAVGADCQCTSTATALLTFPHPDRASCCFCPPQHPCCILSFVCSGGPAPHIKARVWIPSAGRPASLCRCATQCKPTNLLTSHNIGNVFLKI